MYQYVKTYTENGAGYIILNDPKKLNALSQPMAAELSEVLEQFRFDPRIRVIVLRGEGGKFCAGGDITSMKKRVDCYAAGIPAPTQTKTNMANFNHLVLYIRQIEKPVVAWIEGACAGTFDPGNYRLFNLTDVKDQVVEISHIGLSLGRCRDTSCIAVYTFFHGSNVTACTEFSAFTPQNDHADAGVKAELFQNFRKLSCHWLA